MKRLICLIILAFVVSGCGGGTPSTQGGDEAKNPPVDEPADEAPPETPPAEEPPDETPPDTSACGNGVGFSTYYLDADGDTFGSVTVTTEACSVPAGYVKNNADCNDADPLVNPGATEICDGIDNNCSGAADEGLATATYYRDADVDGYGAIGVTKVACSMPAGYVTNNTDCNDSNVSIKPGVAEVCDGVDNNCVSGIDEGVKTTYYRDADLDTYGAISNTTQACGVTAGNVTNSTDCNDSNANIKPSAAEVCDNVDNDCDLAIDEGLATATYYRDADVDGYGAIGVTKVACSMPAGYVANNTDCNDTSALIKPGATEVCDGVDNDCDTVIDEGVKNTYYRDADSDTYGSSTVTTQACTKPVGYVTNSTDCNDASANAKPGGTEICDSLDNDCDTVIDEGVKTTYYKDADVDSYGALANTTQACTAPATYVANSLDCDDTKASVKPGATEVCDGIDNNCVGGIDEGVTTTYYRDADADTYGSATTTTQACAKPAGYVTNSTDCNDSNANIKPNATEVCDGIDNDCDGTADQHVDASLIDFSTLLASSPVDIGDGLPSGYEPSGVVWHSGLDQLFLVSDGGVVTHMGVDGTIVFNDTIGGDLEGVTVANPASNFIYIGVENPDSILEYNIVSQDVTRTFYLNTYMTGPDNSGLEALAFVPDYTSDEGGHFYAGLQATGEVFVFELPIKTSTTSTNVTYIEKYSTHYASEISDMYYDPIDDILYASYDFYNKTDKLVSMPTDGTCINGVCELPFINEWTLTLQDPEGFSLDDSCHIYVGEDTRSVWRY